MKISEKISVIDRVYRNKVKISGSLFLGYASPVRSISEGMDVLDKIKKEHFSATHNCYAIITKNGEKKYSDDGEPNGTAGIRILNTLNSFGLTDIISIITRYFGGTKLGIGPLGKAYAGTCNSLLENAKLVELIKFTKFKIAFEYENTKNIHYLLNKYQCKNIESIFESSPEIYAAIKPSQIENFKNELNEKTSGKALLNNLNIDLYLKLK